ncbi:MAG: tRNA 2-thiouridine(34) synthase MnmA [Candidatus Komeilibacteria bacterium]
MPRLAVSKSASVIVGLSGGVDSAVAAYLLQQQGYAVRAVFMKNFTPREYEFLECPSFEDRRVAYAVAKHLKIPIETWDLEKHYRQKVLAYLYREYRAGRTPNPDVVCNNEIKFQVFLQLALKQKADYIATGHYARIKKTSKEYLLLKGRDLTKDQSYFLSGLNQNQLQQSLFPLGELTKKDVRALAKKIKLPNHDRPDSQGLCFVGQVKMQKFLQAKIKPKPGDIVDTAGNIVGRHPGVYFFTIGQRQGLNLGGGPIRYVVGKDLKKNQLIVGEISNRKLYRKTVNVSDWHWVGLLLTLPLKVKSKLRYRQPDQVCQIKQIRQGRATVLFSQPQRAVTPGQIAVFYRGAQLIASATIR